MKDTYKHKGQRKRLINVLREKGIHDERVLSALEKIPRHLFFDPIFQEHAYEDKAFPIDAGQTISQPYTVAFQSQLLDVQKEDKILEIGTGSGYQASVLCEMAADVYSIEFQKTLYRKAIRFIPTLGLQPHLYLGDGSKGLPKFAPYDKILVTAGAPSIPNALLQQLKVGGRLVIPVGSGPSQQMTLLIRTDQNSVKKSVFDSFSFVPLLGENGHSKSLTKH
ncbi:MAG: protein-L-isoaspartate(D-aspartate) O-methyltransferase [Bacteroidota bacterium]